MLPVLSMEGRVVADPELRFSQSGMPVLRLRIVASSRKKNDETGEWEDDKTLWMGVTAFRKLAENCAESLAKGDLVLVTGRLQTEEWEKDGEKRSEVRLLADTIGPSLAFKTAQILDGVSGQQKKAEAAPEGGAAPAQQDEPPF